MNVVSEAKKKKSWINVLILLVVVISILLGGYFFSKRLSTLNTMEELQLNKANKIIYVKYEGEPLSSDIIHQKYYDKEEHPTLFNEMISSIEEGQIPLLKNDIVTSEMLFFYVGDKVTNATVDGEYLGFQYGEYPLKIEGLKDKINSMQEYESTVIEEVEN